MSFITFILSIFLSVFSSIDAFSNEHQIIHEQEISEDKSSNDNNVEIIENKKEEKNLSATQIFKLVISEIIDKLQIEAATYYDDMKLCFDERMKQINNILRINDLKTVLDYRSISYFDNLEKEDIEITKGDKCLDEENVDAKEKKSAAINELRAILLSKFKHYSNQPKEEKKEPIAEGLEEITENRNEVVINDDQNDFISQENEKNIDNDEINEKFIDENIFEKNITLKEENVDEVDPNTIDEIIDNQEDIASQENKFLDQVEIAEQLQDQIDNNIYQMEDESLEEDIETIAIDEVENLDVFEDVLEDSNKEEVTSNKDSEIEESLNDIPNFYQDYSLKSDIEGVTVQNNDVSDVSDDNKEILVESEELIIQSDSKDDFETKNDIVKLEEPKECLSEKHSQPLIEYSKKDILQTIVLTSENQDIKRFEKVEGIEVRNLCLPTRITALEKYLKCFLCRKINEKLILDIKKAIKNFYEDNYHPFVIVTIPEQKLTNNTIKYVIYESKISNVEIQGNKWFSKKNIQNFISTKKNQFIDTRRVVEDLYWINRNPFRRASILFAPGDKEGTTSVDYLIDDRYPIRLYVGAENTGFEATGKNRILTGFNWGNAWGLDHIVTFQFTTSTDINKFHAYTASYSLPTWGKNILTFYGGYATFRPKPTIIKDLKNKGRSIQFSGRYTFALKATTHFMHDLSIGFDFKKENINLTYRELPFIGNNVNITQAVCEYFGKYEIGKYIVPVEVLLVYSPGNIINDQSNNNFSELRPFAKNSYFYSMQKTTPIFKLPKDFEFVINYKSQFSTNNLLSSEQIGLGGYDTVRGYEYRIVNKDNGVIFNLEGYSPGVRFIRRLHKWNKIDQLKALTFFDFGCGWDHQDISTVKDFIYLVSIGVGARYQIAPYLSLRLDYGFKLHDIKEFEPRNDLGRFHFGVNLNF